jgi:hypothetical protein
VEEIPPLRSGRNDKEKGAVGMTRKKGFAPLGMISRGRKKKRHRLNLKMNFDLHVANAFGHSFAASTFRYSHLFLKDIFTSDPV